ncbi:metallophosphoesterase [Pseudomonas luteola]
MIWFCGDPHGQFEHIIRMVKANRPDAVVLLGDMECSLPLERLLGPIIDMTEIWFIPGNHDCDDSSFWKNLTQSSLANRNLHGRVAEIDGKRVAGLGGVFDRPVWWPSENIEGPQNYQDLETSLRLRKLSPEHLESRLLRYSASIFPEDYFSLAMERADILVCHEAPDCHPYGFVEINELAQFVGATKVFHGHHHEHKAYENSLALCGFEAYSVGLRGIVDEQGRVIC